MDHVTLSESHTSLRIYNTLSKRKEPFCTVQPGRVGIYLCGPTVYDKAHIGHMVGPVIFDCIKRYLTYCGYEVTWVVNITDVDDKLIAKASQRGISMLEVAEENIADYQENLAALGVDQINHFPRATECIDEIIGLIRSLVQQGFAYASDGDVYFDVAKDSGYGKLSNRSVHDLQGEGGATVGRKQNAADFALWKGAKPGEPSWASPWGDGRPGWHIECSAMSRQLLGKTFDIHGGGLDLVFPHHENEIAQSECCHDRPMATYWAHNGLLRASSQTGKVGGRSERKSKLNRAPAAERATDTAAAGGKMSRSKGAGGLAELITRQGGERIRFFLLRTHYRSTVQFNEPSIEEAGIGLESFYRLLKRYQRITGNDFYDLEAPPTRTEGTFAAGNDPTLQAASACRDKFLAAMDDDFNTGGAIGELFELAKLINKFCDMANLDQEKGAPEKGRHDTTAMSKLRQLLRTWKELAGILGIFCQKPTAAANATSELRAPLMQLIIALRATAREKKDFATADTIRDGLAPLGIALEDRAGGTEWTGGDTDSMDGVMQLLMELRGAARANKDFATADTIRNRLDELGITLEDRPGGTKWERN
jgi:cysteinyl-tRNA synthetase